MPLHVEEEAGQLDMGVPETVQDCDAVVPEDFPRLSGGLIRDEQEGDVGSCFGSVDELAGGGGVGAVLDFDSDRCAGAGETQKCVHVSTRLVLRGHAEPGDLAQDSKRLRLELTHKVYKLAFFTVVMKIAYPVNDRQG